MAESYFMFLRQFIQSVEKKKTKKEKKKKTHNKHFKRREGGSIEYRDYKESWYKYARLLLDLMQYLLCV